MFSNIYKNKKVFITGHTGFKGSWLALWLTNLGAKVYGYSLEPNTVPNHVSLLSEIDESIIGNITDLKKLEDNIQRISPDIIFHLAAQPLVRYSYLNPVETFNINLMGTVNILEVARKCKSVQAVINITSDKCYENKEWNYGYREIDPMGGYDPYSASKSCSELITSSYRQSYFSDNNHTLLASARAGNVIGGGDWSEDRLIPDIVKSTIANKKVIIRSPHSTRPWQHVLEPLSGYLFLGQKLLEKKINFAKGWNFGPNDDNIVTVGELITKTSEVWDNVEFNIEENPDAFHEAKLLKLECSQAHKELQWFPVWDFDTTINKTIQWYKDYYSLGITNSQHDLESYIKDAKRKEILWTK